MKKPLTPLAKNLRNNLTEAEKYLWYSLRSENLGFKFRRQAVIGRYIVDFVCFEKKLVVELDGGQHAQDPKDEERTQWLNSQGFNVLRFWDNEALKNRDGVLQRIVERLNSPLPIPPHKGEGMKFGLVHKGEGMKFGLGHKGEGMKFGLAHKGEGMKFGLGHKGEGTVSVS